MAWARGRAQGANVLTDFSDNSPLFPIIGALVIAGVTAILCRFGGNVAEVDDVDDVEDDVPDYLFEFDRDGVREGREYERIEY